MRDNLYLLSHEYFFGNSQIRLNCHPACIGRPVPALADADLSRGAARAPDGHRRARPLLRAIPQRQLPAGVPLLQQVGEYKVRVGISNFDYHEILASDSLWLITG